MYRLRVTRKTILRGAGLSQVVIPLFNRGVVSSIPSGTNLHAAIHFHLTGIMVCELFFINIIDPPPNPYFVTLSACMCVNLLAIFCHSHLSISMPIHWFMHGFSCSTCWFMHGFSCSTCYKPITYSVLQMILPFLLPPPPTHQHNILPTQQTINPFLKSILNGMVGFPFPFYMYLPYVYPNLI